MSNKITKTAQFGGVGGGGSGSAFQPGGSPIGRGGNKGGGYDINQFWSDEDTLEKLISNKHLDADQSDRNFEARLTPQHTYTEENKNYYLTPAERVRARFREELHKHKKLMENHAKSIRENSVEYIQTHFQPKEEHILTIEEKLKQRRKYSDDPKQNYFQYEDDIPELIQPERYHPVISSKNNLNKTADMISRPNQITDEQDEKENIFDKARYTTYPEGSLKTLVDSYDVEEFLGKNKGNGAGVNRNYTSSDGLYKEDTLLDTPDMNTEPSFYNYDTGTINIKDSDLFKPIESQLHTSSPQDRLNRNLPSYTVDNNINTTTEDLGVEDKYKGSTYIGMHSPSPWS
jgi:hypothetical protein